MFIPPVRPPSVRLSIDGLLHFMHTRYRLRDCHLIECDIHVSIGELINPHLCVAFAEQVLSIIIMIISNSGNN